ncbi:MAG: hypothetical protein U9N80_10640, partial [Chloroflexota bacterium]|nr:hypothetical protein [Chloroflexota bacterium]
DKRQIHLILPRVVGKLPWVVLRFAPISNLPFLGQLCEPIDWGMKATFAQFDNHPNRDPPHSPNDEPINRQAMDFNVYFAIRTGMSVQ